MVLNPSKWFYMCLVSKSKINDFIFGDRTKILLTLEHELLGIKIDTNLNFHNLLKQLTEKNFNEKNKTCKRQSFHIFRTSN